ncbi:hypothetical protein QWW93_09635, partial [Neisseria gonorrhoeae]
YKVKKIIRQKRVKSFRIAYAVFLKIKAAGCLPSGLQIIENTLQLTSYCLCVHENNKVSR